MLCKPPGFSGGFCICRSSGSYLGNGQPCKGERLMDVDLIFKIAAVGILVAVLNILLTRSGREDQALMTSIAGLVVVLVIVVQEISELFDLIRDLFGF